MSMHGEGCAGRRGWGPPWARFGHHHGGGGPHHHDGGGFGIRRPLRFLAHKLELSEEQVQELALILDTLKTERAQGAVDDRRAQSAFAAAVAGEAFDAEKAKEAAAIRVEAARRLGDAVSAALAGIHGVLDAEQRKQLALLIRTGPLSL